VKCVTWLPLSLKPLGSGVAAPASNFVFDVSRLKWFPLDMARCPLSLMPSGSEVVRVLAFEGWSQPSIKPMGSGCAVISGISSGVLGLADEQGQASFSVIRRWTFVSDKLRPHPNFSEEFESGNVAY